MAAISPEEASRALKEAGFEGEAFVYHTLGSTNEVAGRLVAEGKPEGTLVLARTQRGGRGRGERAWHSPVGGLYMSLILGPVTGEFPVTLIPMMAGVALAKALADSHGLSPALKWPNDVLLGERKVSGILSEAATFPEGKTGAVLGIGVNVYQRAFPPEIAGTATSIILETGSEPRAFELLKRLLVYLKAGADLLHLGKGEIVVEEWRILSSTLGQMVRVELKGGERVKGRAVDINGDGCLVVDAAGERVPVVAGDVIHLRA